MSIARTESRQNLFSLRTITRNVKPLCVRQTRHNGRDLHRGPPLIIQIELRRPIDTFSGGGFSNSQVNHRGFPLRARCRERGTHLHTELNSSILALRPHRDSRLRNIGRMTEIRHRKARCLNVSAIAIFINLTR